MDALQGGLPVLELLSCSAKRSHRCWVPRALHGALVAMVKGEQVLLHLPSEVEEVMDMAPFNNSQQPALLEGLGTGLQGKHQVQVLNLVAVYV